MPHGQCVVALWFDGNSTEMRFDFLVFDRLTRLKPTSSGNSRHPAPVRPAWAPQGLVSSAPPALLVASHCTSEVSGNRIASEASGRVPSRRYSSEHTVRWSFVHPLS